MQFTVSWRQQPMWQRSGHARHLRLAMAKRILEEDQGHAVREVNAGQRGLGCYLTFHVFPEFEILSEVPPFGDGNSPFAAVYAVPHVVVVGLNLEIVLPQQPRVGLRAEVESVRG